MYDKIKRFYALGLYSENHVAQFVQHGYITKEQYEEITGKEYISV